MNSASYRSFLGMTLIWCAISTGSVLGQEVDLVGEVTAQEILAKDKIFKIYADRYEPQKEALKFLSTFKDSVKVVVFFGSWCRESKKYIPGLMKAMRVSEADNVEIQYIGVDAQKKIPKVLLNMYEIEYIPTVVVLKGTKELGRIEEKPLQPIETDLIQILKKATRKK